MRVDAAVTRLQLAPADHFLLTEACNARLHAREGRAWVTIEGDRRDILLAPGVPFVMPSNARAIVTAVDGPLVVEIERRRGGAPCKRSMLDRVAPWLRAALFSHAGRHA